MHPIMTLISFLNSYSFKHLFPIQAIGERKISRVSIHKMQLIIFFCVRMCLQWIYKVYIPLLKLHELYKKM